MILDCCYCFVTSITGFACLCTGPVEGGGSPYWGVSYKWLLLYVTYQNYLCVNDTYLFCYLLRQSGGWPVCSPAQWRAVAPHIGERAMYGCLRNFRSTDAGGSDVPL